MQSLTRRGAIVLFLTGGSLLVVSSKSLTGVSGSRDADVNIAPDSDALLGIVGQGPVKKNQRDPMVEFTNNLEQPVSITVSLDTCTDGTLYDNEGESGCSVTLEVGSGNSQFADIEASVTGTIPYSISASSEGSVIETTESVEAQSGNVASAIEIKAPSKDNDFTANNNGNSNVFEVKKVDIRDNDGDTDLDKIEYRVKEGNSGGTVVGSKDINNPPGDRYSPNGNPAETIDPDAGYTIKNNQTYTLTVTGYDADGNFSSSTVQDTT